MSFSTTLYCTGEVRFLPDGDRLASYRLAGRRLRPLVHPWLHPWLRMGQAVQLAMQLLEDLVPSLRVPLLARRMEQVQETSGVVAHPPLSPRPRSPYRLRRQLAPPRTRIAIVSPRRLVRRNLQHPLQTTLHV